MIRSRLVSLAVVAAIAFGACEATTLPAPVGSQAPGASSGTSSSEPGAPATEAPATEAPAATEAPEATPEPTPEPTEAPPVDASAAFVDVMGDPLLTANVTFTGTSTLGSTVTPSTGTLDIHKPSSHLTVTTGAGRKAVTTEAMNATGARYVKSHGQWFEAGAAAPENLLAVVTSVDGQVTDTGVETVGGRELHHLTIAPPSTLAAALLLSGKGISNVAGTVDAWVEEDGTPVLMRLAAEWDQLVGKKTVHGTKSLDLSFGNVGEQVAITPPAQVWSWATSRKYGYRMGYPSDWQYEKASKGFVDGFWGYDGDAVFVSRSKSYGFSLNQVTSIVTENAKLWGSSSVKVLANRPGKLGSLPARIVQYTGKYKKVRYWHVLYLAVKSGKIYWVELRTEKKTDAADKALAADFAATFSVR